MTKELHQINYSANSSESIARCIYIGALAGYDPDGIHNDTGIIQKWQKGLDIQIIIIAFLSSGERFNLY